MEFVDIVRAKCKLTDETEAFLVSPLMSLSAAEGVELLLEAHAQLNADLNGQFEGSVTQLKVPARGVEGGIPIDVIKPAALSQKPGIIIYFHGGGHAFYHGPCSTHDTATQLLAQELKCVVVSVDYRTPPSHHFPAMFDDGKAVTRWVLMNKSLVGGEHDSRVGVCGCSAGGGVAASVAFEVPVLDFQILLYPMLDWRTEGESYTQEDQGLMAMISRLVEQSCSAAQDRLSPKASPLLQANFARLPPTLIIAAEADPLRASNYAFKAKLKAANIPCESKLIKGTIHGFFSMPGHFKQANTEAKEIIEKFFKKNGCN